MSLSLSLCDRPEEVLLHLSDRLAAVQRGAAVGSGIPRPIRVIVPTSQFAEWLQIGLARRNGVSMGLEFVTLSAYPRGFGDEVPVPVSRSFAAWKADALRWRILPHVDGFAPRLGVDDGGAGISPRDRLAFAGLLARQLERYGRFRPEGIRSWSSAGWWDPLADTPPEDEAWQRELWRRLAAELGGIPHPACLDPDPADAPDPSRPPLFVVGNDRLDPLMLDHFSRLAGRGWAIECLLLVPTKVGEESRDGGPRAGADDPAAEGNPLMSNLGQRGLAFLRMVRERLPLMDPVRSGFRPSTAGGPTLLSRIQSDLRERCRPGGAPPAVPRTDSSLQIHCCHSPRRELEVLRDELLRALGDLRDLRPHDILVAVTDLDTYAPLIEGVLGAALGPVGSPEGQPSVAPGKEPRDHLPVRLTAIPAREANPVSAGLLALLRLALGRRTASEVIDLLGLPAVLHHLEVEEDDSIRATLVETIRQVGLTHGFGGPGSREEGTWAAAIERIVAGLWFGTVPAADSAAGHLVLPFASDLAQDEPKKLALAGWLGRVASHLTAWEVAVPARDWAERLDAAITHLLWSEDQADPVAAARRLLTELRDVEAPTPLDVGGVLDWLEARLENETSLRTSLDGRILVGRLDQIHGLPCRVLAILGLQDGAFPRPSRFPAWDLLVQRPEVWDEDPRSQDRQCFLDLVLAPTDRLILMASNRSLRTPHDGPLSSCVEDLLRVARDTMGPRSETPDPAQHLVRPHPVHPFSDAYFRRDAALPPSFSQTAHAIATGLGSASGGGLVPFFGGVDTPVGPGPGELSLTDLISFWKNPARGWLKALEVASEEDEDDDRDLDDAPIDLGPLEEYSARDKAIAAKLDSSRDGDPKVMGARLRAGRRLPPGALGELTWERVRLECDPLASALRRLLPRIRIESLKHPIPGGGHLVGDCRWIPGSESDPTGRLVEYRPGEYDTKPQHQLGPFLRTLLMTVCLDRPIECQVLGLDCPAGWILPSIAPERARTLLEGFLEGHRLGRHRPLCHAPETGSTLAEALKEDPGTRDLGPAREEWEKEGRNGSPPGEGLHPAARLAWRDSDPFSEERVDDWIRWSRLVSMPLSEWWDSRATTAEAAAGATGSPSGGTGRGKRPAKTKTSRP